MPSSRPAVGLVAVVAMLALTVGVAAAATAPAAPTIGTAVAGHQKATVSWTAPASDGGSSITGYVVTPFVGFVAQPATTFASTATTQTITGLTNGTTYRFKVAAVNGIGTGPQSLSSNPVIPAISVPDAPTIGVATPGNAQATVSWTAPASDGGSVVTAYVVTPYIGFLAQPALQFPPTLTTQTVTGLTNGTSYRFKVAAVNSVGTGPSSATSNSVTPATVPGAPTIGLATAGFGEVTLSWTAPASNGGSPLTGYAVTPYIGAAAQPTIVFGSTATTQTIAPLSNGTTYRFKVAALNAVGTGGSSAFSNSATPSVTVPGAPIIGIAVAGNGQATVSWTAPGSDGGSPVTGYEVTPYLASVAQPSTVFSSTATAQTVTGLANGTTYTFTVAAVNAIGTGTQSAPSNPATTAGAPGAPAIGVATGGNHQATVSWTTPVSNGGSPVTGYVVTPFIGFFPAPSTTFVGTATTQTVTGLANGTTYRFKVAAINAVGTGPQSATSNAVTPAASVPGPPLIGTATAGNMQATLVWAPPVSDGGSPITGYTVRPYIGAVAQTPVTFGSAATTQTITGLTNGTTYTFTVSAVTAIGTGAASSISNAVTPATVPDAPTIGTATAGNAQATVSWTAPVSNGGLAVTGYVVTPYIGAVAQSPITFSSPATTQTVTGLANGTTYGFTVSAVNPVGTGAASGTSNAVTPAAVPSAPTIGTATPGHQQATVSWTAPVSDGGSPITAYIVTPYIGAVAQTPVIFGSTATTQTLTGLTNGTTYQFAVAALNASGSGPLSAQSNAVTPGPVVPGAPTIGTATGGNAQATVSWTAPGFNGGAAITGYVVTPYIGATAQTPVVFSSSATTQTVSGLTNGTTYGFTVAATNSAGTGPQSAASNLVTPMTVPGAPTIGTATGGNAQATVSWTAPVSNGGSAITGYIVTPYIGFFALPSTTFVSTATTQTVTGLTNGTTYRFKVAAINAVGTGTTSGTSNAVTPAPTVPGAPTIGTATGGNAEATVSWTAPVTDGGSAITGYEVTPYVAAVAQAPVVFGSTATTQTVTGLTNGIGYTFTVAAINGVGTGAASAQSNEVTPATVPDAPTIGTATGGNAEATVSWTAPVTDGGSAITGYEVTPYVAAVAQTPVVFGSTATTQTVTGLTNGTGYTFTVAAINGVGTGAASAESNEVTPA